MQYQPHTHHSLKSLFMLMLFSITVLLFLTCSSETEQGLPESQSSKSPVAFAIKRGTNISHWLSQSGSRGDQRKSWFTRDDVEFIAGLGMDHIRFPVDEEQLWDEQGNMEEEAFALLNSGLDWCAEFNLKAIIDLHIVRAHHFIAEERPLFTDPVAQDNFQKLWRDISSRFNNRPLDMVAYEIMNEPVADDPEDWNKIVKRTVETIRGLEPERVIFVGSNRWCSVETFDELYIPPNDKNIVLTFHFYNPGLLTHHQASWASTGDYAGPVKYPGLLVEEKDLEGLPEELVAEVKDSNGVYNREKLAELIGLALKVAQANNLQLHLGEWGCYQRAPREDSIRWYSDVRSICEENNIAWSTWDYKGGFGIVSRGEPVQWLIDVLMR